MFSKERSKWLELKTKCNHHWNELLIYHYSDHCPTNLPCSLWLIVCLSSFELVTRPVVRENSIYKNKIIWCVPFWTARRHCTATKEAATEAPPLLLFLSQGERKNVTKMKKKKERTLRSETKRARQKEFREWGTCQRLDKSRDAVVKTTEKVNRGPKAEEQIHRRL